MALITLDEAPHRFDLTDNAWLNADGGLQTCTSSLGLPVNRRQPFTTYRPHDITPYDLTTAVSDAPSGDPGFGQTFAQVAPEDAPWNAIVIDWSASDEGYYAGCDGPFAADWDTVTPALAGINRLWDVTAVHTPPTAPGVIFSADQITLKRSSSDPDRYQGEPDSTETLRLFSYGEVASLLLTFAGWWGRIFNGSAHVQIVPYVPNGVTPPATPRFMAWV